MKVLLNSMRFLTPTKMLKMHRWMAQLHYLEDWMRWRNLFKSCVQYLWEFSLWKLYFQDLKKNLEPAHFPFFEPGCTATELFWKRQLSAVLCLYIVLQISTELQQETTFYQSKQSLPIRQKTATTKSLFQQKECKPGFQNTPLSHFLLNTSTSSQSLGCLPLCCSEITFSDEKSLIQNSPMLKYF